MSAQWKLPNQIVKVQSEGDKTATVIVEADPIPSVHPLVLIEEEGSWGVDLIETYALWNHLEGVEKAKVIYRLTGVTLAELPRDESFNRTLCQARLKQVSLAMKQYTQDYDECYPLAKSWRDGLLPYAKTKEVFDCPALPKDKHYGFAYNSKLSRKSEASVSDISGTVAFYETSVLKNNAYGMGENRALRHAGGSQYAFADGHVKWYPQTFKPSFNIGQ